MKKFRLLHIIENELKNVHLYPDIEFVNNYLSCYEHATIEQIQDTNKIHQ